MTETTMISEHGAIAIPASIVGEQVWVDPESVAAIVGWEVKPEGLCRGDVCIPAVDALRRDRDGRVDVVAVAGALHRRVLVDAEAPAVVIGVSAGDRRGALVDAELPPFALPDLAGTVRHSDEWAGRKSLLVAFASW